MNKKTLILMGLILIIAITLPLAVYLVQQQQELRGRAAPATTLCFSTATTCVTAPIPATFGTPLTVNVLMNTGTNSVSAADLNITFNGSLLEATSIGPGALLPVELVKGQTGSGFVSITVGSQPNQPVTGSGIVAIIKFNPKASGTTTLAFDPIKTRASGIQEGSSVIQTGGLQDATITITGGPGPTATPGPTAAPGAGGVPGNNAPTCSSLSLSPGSSGAAPFAVTFTVNGSDKDSGDKITKATFNFGDGKIEDMFDTGGIGTNQVSAQKTHSFAAPGTYNALAFLTDSNGGTSSQDSCKQTITVTAQPTAAPGVPGAAVPTTTPVVTGTPTPTGVVVASPAPTEPVTKGGQPIPKAGNVTPTTIILGVGTLLLLVGGALLLL